MFSSLHRRVRTTPWLGRTVLKSIPDLKWHIYIEPIGKMAIRLRQHRMFWLRPALAHEGFLLGGLQRFVHSGDVVYDIGANIGLYSRFVVQQFGASRVCAFEPMESNRLLLAENVKIAGCDSRVSIFQCAVGNEDGTVEFQIDDLTSNSGALDAVTGGKASPSRAQYGLPPRTVHVKIARLDTLIEADGLPRPDVVKLDVEGAEAMALEGAKHLLTSHGPRLVIELHGAEVARRVTEMLWSFGYHCFGPLIKDDASTYQEVTREKLTVVTDKYSLHYLLASKNRDDLLPPLEEFAIAS